MAKIISRRAFTGLGIVGALSVAAGAIALSPRNRAEDITDFQEVTLEKGKLYSVNGRHFRFGGMKPRDAMRSQLVFYVPGAEHPMLYEVGKSVSLFGNSYEAPGERNDSRIFLRKKK